MWTSVLLWLSVSLLAYALSLGLFRLVKGNALLHPLVVTTTLVGAVLWLSGVPIAEYQQHAGLLHWLLGPATVALAIPMYRQLRQLELPFSSWSVPLLFGGIFAPCSFILILFLFEVPSDIIVSGVTKSITTPLAMEVTTMLGGFPSLAAIMVIVTGMIGAICANFVFRIVKVTSNIAKGISLGTIAHAVGTARALQIHESAGAMSGLALCINGVLTTIVVSLLSWLLG